MLSSPRQIQFVFLAVTLLFAAVIGWLGWRLLQQDRDLARQRRREQLKAVADRITGALYRRLAELDDLLANPSRADIPPGAVLVRASRDGIEVRPAGALLYYPVVAATKEAWELWRVPADGGKAERLAAFSRSVSIMSMAMHPKGGKIAYTAKATVRELWALENFLPALNKSK